MKNQLKSQIFVLSVLLATFISCQRGPYPGFDQTETGLYYKIIRGNSDKDLPVEGDVLTLELSYFLHTNDSLLFSTKNSPDPIELPVQKPFYKGDINEGLRMITEGDSAVFMIKADSFLIYNVGMMQMPPYVNEETMFRFELKVLNHKTSEEYMTEMNLRREQYDKMLEEMMAQEKIDRAEWLAENNITVKPTQSGMYFISEKTGTGAKVERGDLVKAHYTGYFLDGQVFDSSLESPEPFEFVAGRGEVIQGWDEAVLMMRVGGKARIILPSELGYGESDPRIPIPPFSTLVFDLEVVSLTKGEGKTQ
jgi:FKBP-type peptidyl-prolyl cis-trans isomerase FkpA